MNISDRLIDLRKTRGISQEVLAERLKVSRQAVSRWENGTALPDAENLLALSRFYGVTADFLLSGIREEEKGQPGEEEDNSILHTNLTRIAIIAQACFLNAAVQPWGEDVENRALELAVKLIPLLLCSVWMARNHRYEKDPRKRIRNARIELLYCLCQTAVASCGYVHHWGRLTAVPILAVLFWYIFVLNPKHMDRRLVRERRKRTRQRP